MKKTALALRHLAFEDLGLIEPLLVQRGFEVRYHEAGVDDFAAVDLDAVDLLIVLGGPISVEDEERFPWLVDEVALIRQRLDAARPLLGICLNKHTLRLRFDTARAAVAAALVDRASKEADKVAAAAALDLAERVKQFQFRDIRPKAASEIGDVQAASRLLGHTEEEITKKVYIRVGETVSPTR